MLIRNLTRVAAAGLLAAGGVAIAAAPALAADVDLGVQLSGTTIALGTPEKSATVDVTNLGTTKPRDVQVVFDLTQVDPRVELDEEDCTVTAARVTTCGLDDEDAPGPGRTARLPVRLKVTGAGARGDLGELKVTVVAAGDADQTNNSASAEVVLSEKSGPDLWVTAFDIDKTGESQAPIQPGEKAFSWGVVINNGDVDATNIRLDIKLPKDVTFVSEDEGCEYNEAKTEAECSLGDAVLIPFSTSDEDPTGDRVIEPEFEVRLSEDAEGPATVSGGSWTVVGEAATKAGRSASAGRPSWAKAITADELEDLDVDPSDNTDSFAVLIAGEGTGNGNGGNGGGGGGGDDPELPITGPVAARAAGVGAALVGLGGLLVFAARRRRVEGVE